MTEKIQRAITLIATAAVIVLSIYYLESHKPGRTNSTIATELTPDNMPISAKEGKFEKAKELVSPAAFINTAPVRLQDLVGKQVILVDFWTYSCINCQRTLPYLNMWHEKYGDAGLTIVGIHTPEFEFEQKKENVQTAVSKHNITYPVILDNDYATWQAYGNRYWPRKYLIDIDGYIVYDHIGEGAYEETERKIQALLRERSERLGTGEAINQTISQPDVVAQPPHIGSPEIYFGSQRNEYFGNGDKFKAGIQQLSAPDILPLNYLALTGQWNIQPESAGNVSAPAAIFLRYQAQEVYMVASAKIPVTMQVLLDGKPAGNAGGEDVQERGNESIVTIKEDRLYKLIKNTLSGEHTLELRIESPGLQAFTFTFG